MTNIKSDFQLAAQIKTLTSQIVEYVVLAIILLAPISNLLFILVRQHLKAVARQFKSNETILPPAEGKPEIGAWRLAVE